MNTAEATPKLIFFDLDGTLLDGLEFSWQALWTYFGTDKEAVRTPLKQYMNNEITYSEWVDYDIKLLREHKATKADVMAAFKKVGVMPGAIKTLAELKKRGYLIFVVSGGIDILLEMTLQDHLHYFHEIFINRFHFDDQGLLIAATATAYDMGHKATCITDVATKHHVSPDDCVFVGDNWNDIHAALLAGTSIAFNSKSEELVEASTHCVEGNDISEILSLVA